MHGWWPQPPTKNVTSHADSGQTAHVTAPLLAICAGNSPVPGEFPTQRPVTRSFDVFFDLHPNKRLSTQWWAWWFETTSWPSWRHCNDVVAMLGVLNGILGSLHPYIPWLLAPSQWETLLQSNAFSNWWDANLESALNCISPNGVSLKNMDKPNRYQKRKRKNLIKREQCAYL